MYCIRTCIDEEFAEEAGVYVLTVFHNVYVIYRRRVPQALVSGIIKLTLCAEDAGGRRITSKSPGVPNAVILVKN